MCARYLENRLRRESGGDAVRGKVKSRQGKSMPSVHIGRQQLEEGGDGTGWAVSTWLLLSGDAGQEYLQRRHVERPRGRRWEVRWVDIREAWTTC
ncbi:hypothetical protein GOP47_0019708 [Adiantum capillus-veneris]|uniref:Uncharacterized protein n=1 Tax=Adiantum capillus-veneris TaxID=13818 RepID=A0A9D4UCJ3_ADICA|nr:hypothetical protein GOP47_0019708 [Adiantum capillus-veneris]